MTSSHSSVSDSKSNASSRIYAFENKLNYLVLLVLIAIPLLQFINQHTNLGLTGIVGYLPQIFLWSAFLGGLMATRDGRHLSIPILFSKLPSFIRPMVQLLNASMTVLVTFVLARGAYDVWRTDFEADNLLLLGLPNWFFSAIVPVAFVFIGIRFVVHEFSNWKKRLAPFGLAFGALFLIIKLSEQSSDLIKWTGLGTILLSLLLGAPLFVGLAAFALLFFHLGAEPVAASANAVLDLMRDEVMPTIPLFTFAGAILGASGASNRLLRVLRAWLGWLPGGGPIACTCLCALFTAFTGASGVTILALGGLLFPMLLRESYSVKFSTGLLTASGSIGLLFVPSLPVIMYATKAKVPVDQMFMGSFLPGILLVTGVILFSLIVALRGGVPRNAFSLSEALSSLRGAWAELLIPPTVLLLYFSGTTNLVETAALSALSALIVEVWVTQDLKKPGLLLGAGIETATLVGGVIMILGASMALSSYMVDAFIPSMLLEWVQEHVTSKFLFLLVLNGFLLVVGCLMDIYSAIIVVVPLILPVAEHFGIHPIHLGVVFLANMELGFLTPPVGMNLFLTAYRLERSLTDVFKAVLPFILLLFVVLLIITYVSDFTLRPVEWFTGQVPVLKPEIKF